MHSRKRSLKLLALVAAAALVMTGCSSDDDDSSSGSGGGKVALLLPESKTARYESQDRPLFTAKLKEVCADCQLLYSNADQDASKQQSQADAALTNGAKVLVLDPVDAASAVAIVAKANAQKVPVIAYDRLIKDADIAYYISFDNQQVGKLQGEALLSKLTADGKTNPKIVMINGSPTDNNAGDFKKGAHSALDGKVQIVREYDTPDWSPNNAQDEMQQAITGVGAANIQGVYAANDGTAGGAIAAIKGAGISPVPPITGQDAELAGVQRVLTGEQYMTIYKAVKPQAEKAAEVAAALAKGQAVPATTVNTENGKKSVPSTILTPVAVTKDNVKTTVVADGFWTAAQICTAAYAEACKTAGIS